MSRPQDLFALLRSLQVILEAGAKLQEHQCRRIWNNSSVRTLFAERCARPSTATNNATTSNKTAARPDLADSIDRISAVFSGVRTFINYSPRRSAAENVAEAPFSASCQGTANSSTPVKQSAASPSTATYATSAPISTTKKKEQRPVADLDTILTRADRLNLTPADLEFKLEPREQEILNRLEMEHRQQQESAGDNVKRRSIYEGVDDLNSVPTEEAQAQKVTASPNPKSLGSESKQRPVPATRVGRMMSFGGLAAGLGFGTLAEVTKRALGLSNNVDADGNPFMNQSNMDRIVDTLCKVRGAALKIGQILSIQDDTIVNPQLSAALERVRQSADYMPLWQLDNVLSGELGDNWKNLVAEFANMPFAAASIGQVHWARTHDGRQVAMKVQYPGVAKGIESDIDNLIGIMKVWDIFPPGMFVDNVVTVAKRELAWEVNYLREAECTRQFRDILKPYPSYYVPEVIDGLSTKQVFTTEFVKGKPVDQCTDSDQITRNYICTKILELVLREIMEFRYMQTDPNWANFLYDDARKQIVLLDFGASRSYPKEFIDIYVRIIKGAVDNDRELVLSKSRDLGFLTGYESKIMEEAHVDAVMILGDVFRADGAYDFAHQDTTKRLQQIVPIMLAHRLCPPPEEIYSLHRKISGVFLLCAKMKARVPIRNLFEQLYAQYTFG